MKKYARIKTADLFDYLPNEDKKRYKNKVGQIGRILDKFAQENEDGPLYKIYFTGDNLTYHFFEGEIKKISQLELKVLMELNEIDEDDIL